MESEAQIVIAGSNRMLRFALREELIREGYCDIGEWDGPAGGDLPLLFDGRRPVYVFFVGGKSGGIGANQRYPAELMLDNLLLACHAVDSAYRHGAKKLLYLASSCVYPRSASQPMEIGALMTGRLEPTNESYALAKLAGIYLCRAYRQQFGANFISAIVANTFGPWDDFSYDDSHVVAALIRKIHEAKVHGRSVVEVWGSGSARREFIYAADVASAAVFLMRQYDGLEPINVGVGCGWSISELADLIRSVVGYSGTIAFDHSSPDGMPAKVLDSVQLRSLGWTPRYSIREALEKTYRWYLEHDPYSNMPGSAVRTHL